MKELQVKAKKRGKTHKTNIFLGFSGHGTSVNSNLNMTLPTRITEKEYIENY